MSPTVEARACVFCRTHPTDPRWRPFCSERCKLQDLARWADGTYRVPAGPADPDSAGRADDNTDLSEA